MVSVLSQLPAKKGSNPYLLQQIPVPGRRFSHIHVDLIGPLPQSCGYTFLFTIIERTSRWPETIPIQSTTVEESANILLCFWIPTFGVPAVITSGHGAQFTSSIWTSLCRFLPSLIQRPGRKVSSLSQGVPESLVVWNRLVPPSTSGVFPERILLSPSLKLFLVLPWFYLESLDSPQLPSSQHLRRIQSILKNNSPSLLCSSNPETRSDCVQFILLFMCFHQ